MAYRYYCRLHHIIYLLFILKLGVMCPNIKNIDPRNQHIIAAMQSKLNALDDFLLG